MRALIIAGALLMAGCTTQQWEEKMLEKQEVFVLNSNIADVYYRLSENEGQRADSICVQMSAVRSRFHPKHGRFEHAWGNNHPYADMAMTAVAVSGKKIDEDHTEITMKSADPLFKGGVESIKRFVRGGSCG